MAKNDSLRRQPQRELQSDSDPSFGLRARAGETTKLELASLRAPDDVADRPLVQQPSVFALPFVPAAR